MINPKIYNHVRWTKWSDSYISQDPKTIEIPVRPHVGAFGAVRKYDVHEGVDIYLPEGESVFSIEPGIVTKIEIFTGHEVDSDWWRTTYSVTIKGKSGYITYGELTKDINCKVGQYVTAAYHIGKVTQVILNPKERPACMLHLELRQGYEQKLLDPTTLIFKSLRRLGLKRLPGWLDGE